MVRVDRDVRDDLDEIRWEHRFRSLNDVIRYLLDEVGEFEED